MVALSVFFQGISQSGLPSVQGEPVFMDDIVRDIFRSCELGRSDEPVQAMGIIFQGPSGTPEFDFQVVQEAFYLFFE